MTRATKKNWTAGPWIFSTHPGRIENVKGILAVGTVAHQIGWAPDGVLIAAAPDLYDALEQAAEIIRDRDGGNQADETGWADPDMMDAWLSAQRALAKARGGQ